MYSTSQRASGFLDTVKTEHFEKRPIKQKDYKAEERPSGPKGAGKCVLGERLKKPGITSKKRTKPAENCLEMGDKFSNLLSHIRVQINEGKLGSVA